MRLRRRVNEPWALAQLPTLHTRRAHMAHSTTPDCIINMPQSEQSCSYYTFALGYMVMVLLNVCNMEGVQNDEGHGRPLNPLAAVCSPRCANSSCKTQTGRRCSIHACLEIIPGVHFSNSPFCSASASSGATTVLIAGTLSPSGLNLHSRDSFSSGNRISGYTAPPPGWKHPGDLLTISQAPNLLLGSPRLRHLLLAMPRLRQRMRCRRGTSRGLAPVNPPSPLSELSSSSEDDAITPPPASHGNGGRAER